MQLSFDNTETAFAYVKTDKELKSGRWLLKTMHYPFIRGSGNENNTIHYENATCSWHYPAKLFSNNL